MNDDLPLEHISTYFHPSGHILPPPHPPVYGMLFCSPTYIPFIQDPELTRIFSDFPLAHTACSLFLFPTCYKTFIARFEVANLLTYSWYIQKWENSTIIKIFSKFRSTLFPSTTSYLKKRYLGISKIYFKGIFLLLTFIYYLGGSQVALVGKKERKKVISLSHVRLFADPMDCSLPGSSIHGIFQAKVLERVAISFSRGSSQPRDQTWVSCTAGRCFTFWATREAPVEKNLPAMQETQVWSLHREDPLEEGMAPHSSILAWKILWTGEPGGLQSTGSQRVRHNWEHLLPWNFIRLTHETAICKSKWLNIGMLHGFVYSPVSKVGQNIRRWKAMSS